jgi:hypothetical protein
VPDQHGLEVAGIDVEAAADDHVLPAVHQRQEAFGVEAADVAGADEALAVGAYHSASRVLSGWRW